MYFAGFTCDISDQELLLIQGKVYLVGIIVFSLFVLIQLKIKNKIIKVILLIVGLILAYLSLILTSFSILPWGCPAFGLN